MKKTIAVFLLLSLMVGLCACGTDAKPSETVTTTTAAPTTGATPTTGETHTHGTVPTTGVAATNSPTTPVTVPQETIPAATNPPATNPPATNPPTTAPVVTTPPTTTPPATTVAPTTCAHSWTAATCKAPKTCTKCKVTEGGLAGHTEVAVAGKAATCTATGLTEGKKCSVCGTTTVAQQTIPVAAHNIVDVPAKETSCEEAGLTAGKKCSVCGTFTVEQQTIPALEHTFGEWSLGQEPGCNSYGYNVRYCSECGEREVEDIAPTGVHDLSNGGRCSCGYEVQGTNGLSYELSADGTYYICKGYTKYSLPQKIVIPPYYNGKPVKECIGDGVVDLFDTVKEIVISEGVEVIGRMFFYCNGATTITIPSSVKKIHGIGIDCKKLQTAYVASSGWSLGGKAVDLSNPTAAATQLKKYNDGKWYTR